MLGSSLVPAYGPSAAGHGSHLNAIRRAGHDARRPFGEVAPAPVGGVVRDRFAPPPRRITKALLVGGKSFFSTGLILVLSSNADFGTMSTRSNAVSCSSLKTRHCHVEPIPQMLFSPILCSCVVTVGLCAGGTRMPAVQALVAEVTGLKPDVSLDPELAVALGAGIQVCTIPRGHITLPLFVCAPAFSISAGQRGAIVMWLRPISVCAM